MGTKSFLRKSPKIAAVAAGKLHAAALRASDELDFGASLYPVVDGLYATSRNLTELLRFAQTTFYHFGATLICADYDTFRFLIRGAITRGDLVEGSETYRACVQFDDHRSYADRVLMGRPLITAAKCESEAPPFGIRCTADDCFVDETFDSWEDNWNWWNLDHTKLGDREPSFRELARAVADRVEQYFEKMRSNSDEFYPLEKIEAHHDKASAYFQDCKE